MLENANKDLQNIKIIRYTVTDSTNTRAREYAEKHSIDAPVVFIADGQTSGRGRRGRSFDSQTDAGLYISFLYKPKTQSLDVSKITAFAAVKVCRVLSRCAGADVGIKWVNDIYHNGKKLCGILTEGEFSLNGKGFDYVICGIGINIRKRKFSKELSEIATTLEDATGESVDNELLASELIAEFFSSSDTSELIREYKARSVLIGNDVEVHAISGEIYSARVIDISENAGLVVQTADGEVKELISAEVSVRKKNFSI